MRIKVDSNKGICPDFGKNVLVLCRNNHYYLPLFDLGMYLLLRHLQELQCLCLLPMYIAELLLNDHQYSPTIPETSVRRHTNIPDNILAHLFTSSFIYSQYTNCSCALCNKNLRGVSKSLIETYERGLECFKHVFSMMFE